MKRHVLLVTYHFPPDPAIGGVRWASIARHMAKSGWTFDVVAAPEERWVREGGATTGADGVRRIAVTPLPTISGRYRRMRQRREVGVPRARGSAPSDEVTPSRLRREIRGLLQIAGYARGWSLPAAVAAFRAVARGPDVVISSGPPHVSHLVAGAVAGAFRLPWIADFRDPWVYEDRSPFTDAAPLVEGVLARLERWTIENADVTVANTPELLRVLARRYHWRAAALSVVSNGFDPCLIQLPVGKFDRFTISYAGSLYFGRSPGPFLRAFRHFVEERGLNPSEASVVFCGPPASSPADDPGRLAAQEKLQDYVEVVGEISREDATALTARSHAALVFAQNQPLQVPAKLYECLGLATVVLACAPEDSATGRLVSQIDGHWRFDPEDEAGMADALHVLYDRHIRVGSRAKPIGPPPPERFGYDKIGLDMERLVVSIAN